MYVCSYGHKVHDTLSLSSARWKSLLVAVVVAAAATTTAEEETARKNEEGAHNSLKINIRVRTDKYADFLRPLFAIECSFMHLKFSSWPKIKCYQRNNGKTPFVRWLAWDNNQTDTI